MKTSSARGQAAVEFALGSLVFVTVLLFGIHFAEVGYLSAKVHEAGAAAMWDATAYRSYSYGPIGGGGWYDAAALSAPSANNGLINPGNADLRYRDWNGLSRTNGGGTGPQMVLTKAQPMTVQCTDNRAITAFGLPAFAPTFGEPGGVTCSAQGDFGFGVMRMPNKLAEGANGFFKAPHNSRIGTPTTLCSSGRATGGTCLGSLSVLLGDDALTEGQQALQCQLRTSSGGGVTCLNPMYYAMNRQTWDKSMQLQSGWASGYTGAPEAWAQNATTGVPGGQITGFYTSLRGEETNFTETVESGLGGGVWQSSPMDATMPAGRPYRESYQNRNTCRAQASASSGYVPGPYCFLGKFPCGG
jgi:hypothetical protein